MLTAFDVRPQNNSVKGSALSAEEDRQCFADTHLAYARSQKAGPALRRI